MTDERLILAIGRLERALARVETAALTLVETPGQVADHRASPRDEALKDAARDAIARIDRLLGNAD